MGLRPFRPPRSGLAAEATSGLEADGSWTPVVRTAAQGSFAPLGGTGRQKLKDLFVDAKIDGLARIAVIGFGGASRLGRRNALARSLGVRTPQQTWYLKGYYLAWEGRG